MGAETGRLPGLDVTRDREACMLKARSRLGGTGRKTSRLHSLHEAGTFFVPFRLGGISLSATGIPAQAGRFLSYKHFIPSDRGNVTFLFSQFAVIWTIVFSYLHFISIT